MATPLRASLVEMAGFGEKIAAHARQEVATLERQLRTRRIDKLEARSLTIRCRKRDLQRRFFGIEQVILIVVTGILIAMVAALPSLAWFHRKACTSYRRWYSLTGDLSGSFRASRQ
mgnify:CR=1 FL=1